MESIKCAVLRHPPVRANFETIEACMLGVLAQRVGAFLSRTAGCDPTAKPKLCFDSASQLVKQHLWIVSRFAATSPRISDCAMRGTPLSPYLYNVLVVQIPRHATPLDTAVQNYYAPLQADLHPYIHEATWYFSCEGEVSSYDVQAARVPIDTVTLP